jgi:regulator of RNase E activity RraA
VLVVDGGGSKRCALLGDNIAEMAYKNGWSVSGRAAGPVTCPGTCPGA